MLRTQRARIHNRCSTASNEASAWKAASISKRGRNGTNVTLISFSANATGRSPPAGCWLLTLVLASGMVWLSTRSKFIPYVVEVDKLGYAISAPSALTENTTRISTDRMVRYELAAFIRNAREVITDPAPSTSCIGQVYSRARGPAYKFLDELLPLRTTSNMIRSRLLSTNPSASRSIRSCRCRKRRGRCDGPRRHRTDGSPVATTHWEAALDTSIISATSDSSILENPLGFYVTQLNWTEQRS